MEQVLEAAQSDLSALSLWQKMLVFPQIIPDELAYKERNFFLTLIKH